MAMDLRRHSVQPTHILAYVYGMLDAVTPWVTLVAKGLPLQTLLAVVFVALLFGCQESPPWTTSPSVVVTQGHPSRISSTSAPALEPALLDIGSYEVRDEFQVRSQLAVRITGVDRNNSEGAEVYLLDGSGLKARICNSDPAGIAHFDNLPAGVYQVWASTAESVSQLLTVEAYPEDEVRVPTELALSPATHLSGRVHDPNNLGIQAEIALNPHGHDHTVFRAKSDAAGVFAIPALPKGAWELHVTADAYAQSEIVRILATQREAHQDIALAPKGSISGTVVDERDNAVVGAQIHIRRLGQERRSSSPLASGKSSIRWIHPLTGKRQLPIRPTRRFGAHRSGVRPAECGNGHCGVDIGVVRGSAVVAAASGTVVVASNDDRGKSGRYVAIEHVGGFKTFYMHLDSVDLQLEVGSFILAGSTVGTLGRSGIRHSDSHLHFAVSKEYDEQPRFIDPEPMLRYAVVLPAPAASRQERPGTARAESPLSEDTQGISDENGSFQHNDLAAGDYVVTVSHPKLASGHGQKLSLQPGQSMKDVRIVLRDGISFEARVFGPDGPVADTWIRAYQGQGESRRRLASAAVDSSGRFRLRPLLGAIDLEIGAAGFGVIHKKITAEDMTTTNLVFELSRFDAEIRGQVRSPSGTPLPAAQVQILSGPAGRGRRTTSDDFGFFSFGDIPSGTYSLRIRSGRFPELDVSADTLEESEFILHQGGGLAFVIRDDHSDQSLAGLRISLRGPEGVRTSGISDSQGKVVLTGLSPGAWLVQVNSPEHTLLAGTFAVVADESSPEVHELRLRRGAKLKGILWDHLGERASGARVWLGDVKTTTDGDGVFQLDQVNTGDVVLRARWGDEEGALPLGLFAGDELVTLELTLEQP